MYSTGVERIITTQRHPCPNPPEPVSYVILQHKRNFADANLVKNFEIGVLSWTLMGGPI